MTYQSSYKPVSPTAANVQTPDDPFYNQTNKFALDQAKIIGDESLEQTNAGLEKLSQYSKTALDMFTNLKGAVQRNAYTRGLIAGAKPATADQEETKKTGDAAAGELAKTASKAHKNGEPQGLVNQLLGASLGWQRGVEQGRFNQTMQELPLYLKKLASDNNWDQLPPEEYQVAMKEASAAFIRQTGLDGEPIYWNPDNQLLLHQTAQKAIKSAVATHTARYDLMQAGANQEQAFNILGTTIDEAAETGDYTAVSKAYHQAGVAAFVNKANTSRAIAVKRRHDYMKRMYVNGSPEVREAIENFIILDGPGKGKKFGVHRKYLIQEWKRDADSTKVQDYRTEQTLKQQASDEASRKFLKQYSEDGYISPAEIDDYINNHHDSTLPLPNWVRLSQNEHTRGREESNREDWKRFTEADIYKDEKALRELMHNSGVNPAVRRAAANALKDLQKSGDAQHKHEYEGIENAVEIQAKISQTGKNSLHGNAIEQQLKREYLLKQAELIKENEVAKGRKLTSQEIKLVQQQAAQSVIDSFHERLREDEDNKDAAFYQDGTGFPNIIKELTKGLPATVQDRVETANDLFNANGTEAITDKRLFNLTHEELRNNMEVPPAVKEFARIHGMNSLELWQDHLKKAHGIEMKQVSTRGFNVSMFPEYVQRLLAGETGSIHRVNRAITESSMIGGSTPDYDNRKFTYIPEHRAFLDMIAFAEGTYGEPNSGYSTKVGFGQFDHMAGHDRVKPKGQISDASGRYQFLSTTWDNVGGGAMTPEAQDWGAMRLALARLGLPQNMQGVQTFMNRLKTEGLSANIIDALAPEWASMPNLFGPDHKGRVGTGTSYYGQGGKSLSQLQNFYNKILKRYRGSSAQKWTHEV